MAGFRKSITMPFKILKFKYIYILKAAYDGTISAAEFTAEASK